MNYKVFYALQIIFILVLSLPWLMTQLQQPAVAVASVGSLPPYRRLTGNRLPDLSAIQNKQSIVNSTTGVLTGYQPNPPLKTVTDTATLEPIVVDAVTDAQVTGYPDSRKIVRDSQDNLYIAYRKKTDDGKFHTFVAALPSGERQFLNTDQSIESQLVPETQRVPSLTIDEEDVLHVVWYGPDNNSQNANERQIRYTRAPAQVDDPLVWDPVISPAGRVDGYDLLMRTPNVSRTMWQEHPVIFAAGEQTLYIAWEGRDRDHLEAAQIKWVRSTDGGETWSRWQNIPGEAGIYYSRPTIIASADRQQLYVIAYATGTDKVAHLVWTQSLDADEQPGDRWAPWRYVTDSDGDGGNDDPQDQRHPSAVFDSQGQLHLVWQQQTKRSVWNSPSQIHYAVYLGHNFWSLALPIRSNPEAEQTYPSITVDKDDRLWVAWSEQTHAARDSSVNAAVGKIRVVKKPVRSQWQAIDTPIVSQGHAAFYPTFRWNQFGVAHGVDLVWVESEVTKPINAECVDGRTPACTIYYANVAGQ